MNESLPFIVLGGANGVGKSTLARVLLDGFSGEYLNTDDIAHRISPHDWDKGQIAAAQEFIHRLQDCLHSRRSVMVESTLSGRTLVRHLKKAAALEYRVHTVYVWLGEVETNLQRVAARVRRGGHPVPPDDVRRRYWRSISNFWTVYRPASHTWDMYNNDHADFRGVAFGEGDDITVESPELWTKFEELLDEIQT